MTNLNDKIGFMQGRLTDLVDGKIQAFPWNSWKKEFQIAADSGISLMEWTLDYDRLYENPLLTDKGKNEIKHLMQTYLIRIESLTGDCFMQAPFWKSEGSLRDGLIDDFKNIVNACSSLSIKYIVVPLVDNGNIENDIQMKSLISGLDELSCCLKNGGVKIVFESDYEQRELLDFIVKLDEELFGINYDIGNSAALGYNPVEEIRTYCNRIWNVHVKDRVLNGTTVPLGQGNADLEIVFSELNTCNYAGNYILQTARADNNKHAEVLINYKNMVKKWVEAAGA